MNTLKLTFILALAIFLQPSLQGQEWIPYVSEAQINDLVKTADELLMATDAGVVVMNKTTLEKTIFNKKNTSLSNNHIQSITQAADGSTWIGTYDVILARFDGSDFVDVTMPDSDFYNQNTELYDLKVAPNGDLWAGTTDGVFHRAGQNWIHYGTDVFGPNFFEAWDIEFNADGDVFVGANNTHKLSNGVWSVINDPAQLFGYLHSELFFTSTGDMFMGGDLDRIGRYDGTQWEIYDDFGMALNGSHIKKFAEDADGNIYFQTLYDGIFKLEGNVWVQQADAQSAAFDNKIDYLHIDEQNRRWWNHGIYLSVNDNSNLQTTTIPNYTLEDNNIKGVHKGANGNMYFITRSNDNIAVLDPDGNWSFLPVPSSVIEFENFNDILVFSANDIWVSSNHGLHHYDGNQWAFEDLGQCRGLASDSQGKVYALLEDRIRIIDNSTVTEYNTTNSEISTLILINIGIDAADNLWLASFDWDGSAMVQNVSPDGTWTTYDNTDHPILDGFEGDFHFDRDGNVWLPRNIAGAYKFDGSSWTNPFLDNFGSITNADVNAIESDAEGRMYFAHQFGVTTLLDGEWENLIIEDVEPNFSHPSVMQFDNDGTLWWGSNRYGVYSYTPQIMSSTSSQFELNADVQVYPNPASVNTNIEFTLMEKAEVAVSIYNSLGQLQINRSLGLLSAGTFQQGISIAHLPKGIYHITLQINDESVTKKLMIQ